MNVNNLTYKDHQIAPSEELGKGRQEFRRTALSDVALDNFRRANTKNGKVCLKAVRGIPVELRTSTLNSNKAQLRLIKDTLSKPDEVWQSLSGERYTHRYLQFFPDGAFVVEVTFSFKQQHRVESARFISNPDSIRKGVLYG